MATLGNVDACYDPYEFLLSYFLYLRLKFEGLKRGFWRAGKSSLVQCSVATNFGTTHSGSPA